MSQGLGGADVLLVRHAGRVRVCRRARDTGSGYVLFVTECESFFGNAGNGLNGTFSVWPAWEVQGHGTVTADLEGRGRHDVLPPWFSVRLTFADGSRVDVLAVVSEGRISIEDMHSEPPMALDGFAALAEWIEEPLADACRVAVGQQGRLEERAVPRSRHGTASGSCDVCCGDCAGHGGDAGCGERMQCGPEGTPVQSAKHRARPSWLRGGTGRRVAADAYRAAQEEGRDPVLAVMYATGRSRRRSLRLIAGARDEGYLAPRHNRR